MFVFSSGRNIGAILPVSVTSFLLSVSVTSFLLSMVTLIFPLLSFERIKRTDEDLVVFEWRRR